MESNPISTKGWNWGYYNLGKENLDFSVNGQKCFIINYKDIALCNASGKNEIALEFNQEADNKSYANIYLNSLLVTKEIFSVK